MEKMQAQVLVEHKNLQYCRIDVPECTKEQVLVKLTSAAICNGSDPSIFDGFGPYKPPFVFGHEPYGEIVECGANVTGFAVGDMVTWWFSLGAFAEYVAVDPTEVGMVKVPSEIGVNEAPILELATACGRAVHATTIRQDQRVLILGLGPSGLIMCQQLRSLGAQVAGWDLHPMRRQMGLQLGCLGAYDSFDLHVVEKTEASFGSVDLIIDAMGDDKSPKQDTLHKALLLLNKGGKIVSYGHPPGGRWFDPYVLQNREASIVTTKTDTNMVRQILQDNVKQVVKGEVQLAPLVSKVIPLSDVLLGLNMVRNEQEKYLKIIVRIS